MRDVSISESLKTLWPLSPTLSVSWSPKDVALWRSTCSYVDIHSHFENRWYRVGIPVHNDDIIQAKFNMYSVISVLYSYEPLAILLLFRWLLIAVLGMVNYYPQLAIAMLLISSLLLLHQPSISSTKLHHSCCCCCYHCHYHLGHHHSLNIWLYSSLQNGHNGIIFKYWKSWSICHVIWDTWIRTM